jgi:DNA-binding response OmpR family regulator
VRRPTKQTGTNITVGDLSLDTNSYEVKRGEAEIKLSQKEFALLEYFMHHAGQVITKDMIISHVWDEEADVLPNTIEVYIGYLRNKIDRPFPEAPPLLQTMRGFGYKLTT